MRRRASAQTREACKRAEHAARGRAGARCSRPSGPSGPAFLFSFGRSRRARSEPRWRRARRGPQEYRASPALPRTPAKHEPNQSARSFKAVCLWRCPLASPSATRRKRTEKRKTPGAGERKAAKPSEEQDAHRPRQNRSKARARKPSLEIISIKARLCSRTYCCSEFQGSRIRKSSAKP